MAFLTLMELRANNINLSDFCLAHFQRISLLDITKYLESLIHLSSLNSVIESILETFGFSIKINL